MKFGDFGKLTLNTRFDFESFFFFFLGFRIRIRVFNLSNDWLSYIQAKPRAEANRGEQHQLL